MFKVGDRVRLTGDNEGYGTVGDVGVVVYTDDMVLGSVDVQLENGDLWLVATDSLELEAAETSRGEYFMYGVTGIERSSEEINVPLRKRLYRACRATDGKWVVEKWSEATYVIATARDETEADAIASALNQTR